MRLHGAERGQRERVQRVVGIQTGRTRPRDETRCDPLAGGQFALGRTICRRDEQTGKQAWQSGRLVLQVDSQVVGDSVEGLLAREGRGRAESGGREVHEVRECVVCVCVCVCVHVCEHVCVCASVFVHRYVCIDLSVVRERVSERAGQYHIRTMSGSSAVTVQSLSRCLGATRPVVMLSNTCGHYRSS